MWEGYSLAIAVTRIQLHLTTKIIPKDNIRMHTILKYHINGRPLICDIFDL